MFFFTYFYSDCNRPYVEDSLPPLVLILIVFFVSLSRPLVSRPSSHLIIIQTQVVKICNLYINISRSFNFLVLLEFQSANLNDSENFKFSLLVTLQELFHTLIGKVLDMVMMGQEG